MKSKGRKIIILSVKLLLAAVMLAWVLSQVHWHDYVEATDSAGKTQSYPVLEVHPQSTPQQLTVAKGRLWWVSHERLSVAQLQYADKKLAQAREQQDPSVAAPSAYQQVRRLGVRSALQEMSIPLLVLACAGFLCSVLIIAVRWWFLLRLQDIRVRLWEAVRLTFLGQFFNYVVPGTVGGDLVKAYYISKHTPRKAAVLVSVFVDRVLGLTELVLLGGVMLIVVVASGLVPAAEMRDPIIVLAVVAFLVVNALVFLLSERFRRLFHLQKIYQRLPIAHHFAAAGEAAQLYRQRLPELAKAIAFTFGAHILFIGSIAMIGFSLHLDAKWYTYFVYVPVIYIVGAVPITPGAVGLIEMLYQMAFAGSNASKVIVLALLARLIPMLWGLPGAVVAVTGPKLPKAAEMEAELQAGEAASSEVAVPQSPESA